MKNIVLADELANLQNILKQMSEKAKQYEDERLISQLLILVFSIRYGPSSPGVPMGEAPLERGWGWGCLDH